MTLHQKEETEGEYRQKTGRETDTAETQTAPLPTLTNRAASTYDVSQLPRNDVSTANRFIEAFLLTLAVGGASLVFNLIWMGVVPLLSRLALSISSVTFWYGAISFFGSVLIALAIGVGTGVLANRQSMIGSLIAANGINFVFWRIVQLFALPQQYRGNWKFTLLSLAQGVLGLVTITVAEILIARLVAGKNRAPGR